MAEYILYNSDVPAAAFDVTHARIATFRPLKPALLPMQLVGASADGFTLWLHDRAIDLNNAAHRALMHALTGSRDRTTLALITHMFSVSDTFTCFESNDFQPRATLCQPEEQEAISQFILLSGDTSLRRLQSVTPNAATDGGFTKTWRLEDGEWWLYKLQPTEAVQSEAAIARALSACGWDTAAYEPVEGRLHCVRTRCFLRAGEWFEPYESFRYAFEDIGDDDAVIQRNLSSLGPDFAQSWRRIQAADALFCNTDRHMRNFGVIRSADTGAVLRLAPNFDNNQACTANPGGYSAGMLRDFLRHADAEDRRTLAALAHAVNQDPWLRDACAEGLKLLG